MKIRFSVLGFVVAATFAVAGCTKDTPLDVVGNTATSNEIGFGSSVLTRGDYFNEISNLGDMRVFAYYTEQSDYSSSGSYDYFMHSQKVEQANSVWSYSPVKYWSNNDDDKFTFFAYAPADALCTFDDETDSFDYKLQQFANDNDDLLVAATYNQTKNAANGNVELQFKHALQRISFYGAVIGKATPMEQLQFGETNVRYAINGVTLEGVYSEGKVSVDSNGDVQWSDITTPSTHTATQGVTLLAYNDDAADLNDISDIALADRTSSHFTPVNAANKGLFVLPQTVPPTPPDDAPEGTVDNGAKIVVRVRRIFDLVEWLDEPPKIFDDKEGVFKDGVEGVNYTTIEVNKNNAIVYKYVEIDRIESDGTIIYKTTAPNNEIIYETDPIPFPDNTVWSAGEWINLLFTFDVSQKYAMPLTVTSEMYSWTEADVDVVVNPNIYVYTSESEVEIIKNTNTSTGDISDDYGEFLVCTNYVYNLRVPHYRIELDGSITSSRGFMFVTNDFVSCNSDNNDATFTYSVGNTDQGEELFLPTLLDLYGNEYPYVTKDDIPADEQSNYSYCNHKFAYSKGSDGEYHLNYFDPNNGNAITQFKCIEGVNYHEIDLSDFADPNNRVYFKIKIGATDGVTYTAANPYHYFFSVLRTNREDAHLYTNTSTELQASGINKADSDAVYVLRLIVEEDHFIDQNGRFEDAISVEMVSNGGGYITSIFDISIYDPAYIP